MQGICDVVVGFIVISRETERNSKKDKMKR